MIQFFLLLISFCIFKNLVSAENRRKPFFSEAEASFISWKVGKKDKTLKEYPLTLGAINSYTQDNPAHFVKYVKGLGYKVFSQDEYQESLSQQFSAQYQELLEQKKSLEVQIKESQQTIETQAISFEKIKKELDQKSELFNQLTVKEQELNSQIEKLKIFLQQQAKAKEAVEKNLSAQTNQVKNLDAKILSLNKEIEEYNTQIVTLKNEKQTLETQYNQLNADYKQQQAIHQTAIETANSNIQTANSNITQQSKEISVLNLKNAELQTLLNQTAAAFEEFKEKHAGCNVNDVALSLKSSDTKSKKTQKKSNEFQYSKDRVYKVLCVLPFCSLVGLSLYICINSIKNGLSGFWELRHAIPSVSFKMPHIPFSNPFANFSIGDWIALRWTLLRNYLHI